jgi:hypothetical protein
MAPINKWDQKLDPEVRRQLAEARVSIDVNPTNALAHPEPSNETVVGQSKYVAPRPPPVDDASDPVLGARLELDRKVDPSFSPNNIALLLDDKGHLMVPLYVEREAIADKPVPVAGPDGVVAKARYLGSDRQTNLTLLEVERPAGRPVRLGKNRPEFGSLVLCLSPADGSARLSLWTDGAQQNGVVINTGGEVCGIARYGQFLTVPSCRLIAEHLIHFGAVKRATLGITVTEIRQDDTQTRTDDAPRNRTAVRVDEVIPRSVADQCGLKPGDLIISLAGEQVTDLLTFAAAIAARDGDTDLKILRGDKVLAIQASLVRK